MAPLEPYVPKFAIGETIECYEDGTIAACSVVAPCFIETPAGNLVPQYSTDDLRKKTLQALTFYRSGALRSLPLEKQSFVKTPVGELPAELVTFYESGALKRVFPLNGKLSGYWGEEDEAALSEELTLHVGEHTITARCISIKFYEQGSIESITLWPDETVVLETPCGKMPVRIGMKFSRTGDVLSVEPAVPVVVETPIGQVTAYDNDAVGVVGDTNSLSFYENGEVRSIATMYTKVVVTDAAGKKTELSPALRESLCGDEEKEITPMVINFMPEEVQVINGSGASTRCFRSDQYTIEAQRCLFLDKLVSC